MERKSVYNLLIVLVVCLGSLTYGYAISVLATTLTKSEFYVYFQLETEGAGKTYANAIIATWNCLLYVGAVIGGILYMNISNRWGRKMPLAVGSCFTIIGSALQAGSVDVAMLATARAVIGVGLGLLLPGIPLYQAEVSPPHGRGFMVGLHGSALGIGNLLAQWLGVAFFKSGGQASWRVPLAVQCAPPLALLLLLTAIPESPRWLYMHGKEEKAKITLVKLHRDKNDPSDHFALQEFRILKAQIDIEMRTGISTWKALRTPSVRRRYIIGILTMLGAQSTGLVVLLSYSPVIFEGLGFSAFATNILTGGWTTLNFVGNFIGALIVDRVGRRSLLICGYIAVTIGLIGATILTKLFAGTDTAGNKVAVFFFFWIMAVYTVGIEAVSFVYISEIFPTAFRAQGVAFSMQGLFLSAILWTAVSSPALASIGWRFYIVFICNSMAMSVVVFFFFPETKGFTLEQVSRLFGETVVDENGQLNSDTGTPPRQKREQEVEMIEDIHIN